MVASTWIGAQGGGPEGKQREGAAGAEFCRSAEHEDPSAERNEHDLDVQGITIGRARPETQCTKEARV
jgi:hypothetical protein